VTEHDDDDPQLKSLRAVWLDMRDEDPPERGLAELMAAARVKAVEMREADERPTLWQRISALLRRPPVLALATAMVLLGGVVLIGTRGEKMQAEPPSLREEQGTVQASGGAAVRAPVGSAAQAPAGSAAPTTGDPQLAEPEIPAIVESEITENKPDKNARDVKAGEEKRGESSRTPTTGRAKPPRRATASSPTDNAAGADSVRAPQTLDETSTYSREATSAFESEAVVGGAKGTAAPEGRAPAQTSRAPQFLAEAKAAATRGDCARAQAWLKRLAAEDANAYRKALASDSRLRSCVVVE
jgi:hypothetical protein